MLGLNSQGARKAQVVSKPVISETEPATPELIIQGSKIVLSNQNVLKLVFHASVPLIFLFCLPFLHQVIFDIPHFIFSFGLNVVHEEVAFN